MLVQNLFYVLIIGSTLAYGKKSFVVIIDTTRSMLNEIIIIKNNMEVAVKSLINPEIENYILVPFSDPHVGVPLVLSKPEELINFLSDIEVSDGKTQDDCPENSLTAIEKALEISENKSNIFLFTDAPAKDLNKLQNIQSLCRQRQSQVVIFLSGQCSEETGNNINAYYEIAKSCCGSVFHIDLMNLRHLKPFKYMKEMVAVEWSNVKTHTEFMGSKKYNFDVDTYTKDIVVAVSGDFPEMYITHNVDAEPEREIIMETRRSLVIRLLQLKSGEYTVEIRSRGLSMVTFYRRKELSFQYGFSPRRPRSLKETSKRPLPDSDSYLMVELMDNSIEIFLLELQTGNDKKILDIEILDQNKGLYVAQSHFEANRLYQICVHGREKNTYEVIKGIKNIRSSSNAVVSHPVKAAVEMIEMESTTVDFMTDLTIFCKVNGDPEPDIWWEDESGDKINSENFLLDNPSMYISYVTISNATVNTTIYCKCENSGGSDSLPMELFVHRDFVFEVIQSPSDTTIEYGNEGKLYCQVSAYPEASVKWHHNGSAVEDSENVKVIPEENMLLIKNMTLDDTGEYVCEATNDIETRSFTANVDISGLEAPSIELSQSEYILQPGDWMKVECNIVKGNPPPVILWKKRVDDSEFGDTLDDIPDGVYVEENFLKIPFAKSEHNGTYICEATNIQGKDSKAVVIKIHYAPKIKNGDEIKTVRDGESVVLECEVDAMPEATVHWDMYQDDVIIAFDDRHRTDERHTHRFNAISHDSGNYHCIAENSMGHAERIVTVNVLVPPFIEPLDFKTLTVRAGDSKTLTCNVSIGNPMPTTRWEFISSKSPATVLSRKVTTKLDLVLRNVTKKEEGTYQCVAENEVAPDTIKFFLRVQQ